MASAASGGAGRTRGPGRIGLDLGDRRIGLRSRQKEGSLTGPNPVDRGKKGSKLHILSDAQGIPLAVAVSGANMHDSLAFKPLILGIPAGRSRRGPRRRRPVKLRADKAYFSAEHLIWLRERGLVARIARPGFESGERLGRHRWKIDRSLGSSATGGAVAAPRPALGSPIRCPRHARGAVGAPAAGCPQRVKLQASETLYSRRVGCRASSRPGLWRGRRELQTARHADMDSCEKLQLLGVGKVAALRFRGRLRCAAAGGGPWPGWRCACRGRGRGRGFPCRVRYTAVGGGTGCRG